MTGRILLGVVLLLPALGRADGLYSDVAVIVNTNSTVSQQIATHYQQVRGIPAVNMIPVSVPEREVIDDATFQQLRSQVESYLTAQHLTSTINYLVTTKGLPLKINREAGGAEPFSATSASASLESELALLLGSSSSAIGKAGRASSPYYAKGQHFSRARYGIFLVTRLDGYTLNDVLALIDRSRPGILPSSNAVYVLDEDPGWNSTVPYLNSYLADASQRLRTRGKQVVLNADSIYVTNTAQVIGYASWGSNDHHADDFTEHAQPHNDWAEGAIAETYVSTSARSFSDPPTYGQSLIADLIEEGISGVKGYVYEPYASAMSVTSVLFDSYAAGYNLAESYGLASPYLSWMDVVIGDPKASIDGSGQVPLPVTLSSFTGRWTAAEGTVRLTWTTQSEIQNYGFAVQRRSAGTGLFVDVQDSLIHGAGMASITPRNYEWHDHAIPAGRYEYRLRQIDLDGTEHYSEPVTVDVAAATGIAEEAIPRAIALAQNYPNPFNPATTLEFTLAVTGRIRLTIYNALGQEIAVLVDGTMAGGRHTTTWNASGYASGTYFCRLESAGTSATRKMTLMR